MAPAATTPWESDRPPGVGPRIYTINAGDEAGQPWTMEAVKAILGEPVPDPLPSQPENTSPH